MSKQQEALANMWPLGLPAVAGLFGGIGLGQGGAAPAEAAQQQPKAEAKKEAAKPVEEKKDVLMILNFNFLTKFPAAKQTRNRNGSL